MTVLSNTLISNIPVVALNAEKVVVALPANPVVAIDQTSAGTVAMGADGQSVDFTPSQPPSASDEGVAVVLTLTVTNADGSVVVGTGNYTVGVAVAPDTTVASLSFNDAGIVQRPLS